MAKTIEREKKTSEQIKQRILEELDKQQKPLSVQDISKEIGSNWLTIRDYIQELQQKRKVKEIVLGDKKVFRLVREDTYLDIPITKDEKEKFYFLFDNAKKLFREFGRENPTKIQVQKSIVNVIDKFSLQVPTVWYLYGKMTLMKYEPEKDYSQYSIQLENQGQVVEYMRKIIGEVIRPFLARNKIKLSNGKKVIEIKPQIAWNKGRAVAWLLAREADRGGQPIMPVYLGDDATDEDAFGILKNKGLTIYIGNPKDSQAKYYLKDTREVFRFLKNILGLCKD